MLFVLRRITGRDTPPFPRACVSEHLTSTKTRSYRDLCKFNLSGAANGDGCSSGAREHLTPLWQKPSKAVLELTPLGGCACPCWWGWQGQTASARRCRGCAGGEHLLLPRGKKTQQGCEQPGLRNTNCSYLLCTTIAHLGLNEVKLSVSVCGCLKMHMKSHCTVPNS